MSLTTEGKDTRMFRISKKILDVIGEKAGVSFSLEILPGIRADKYLKKGVTDGDIGRVVAFGARYPEFIKVPEPIISFEYFVFTNREDIKAKTWRDLAPNKVVYVLGTTFIEANLKHFHENLHAIGSLKQAILFVGAGRADLFISSPLEMEEFIKRGELKRFGIKMSKPAISKLNFHTYFHPKHKEFAKIYNKILIDLKKDGTYNKVLFKTR